MTVEQMLTALSVVTWIVAAIIAVSAFRFQKRQSYISLQATALREFAAGFFGQQNMRTTRFLASEFGLKRLDGGDESMPPVVLHLMDFLDLIAVCYNRRAFDDEVAFARFYYWVSHYWSAFGPDIPRFESKTGLRAYANIPIMVENMTALGRKIKWIEAHHAVTPDKLRRFFLNEMDECASE